MAVSRGVVRDRDFDIMAIGVFGSIAAADEALLPVEFALAHENTFDAYPLVAITTRGPIRAFKTKSTRTIPACVVLFAVV